MAEATVTTDLGAPQRGVVPLNDLSIVIKTADLSTQPNNPFQGVATVTGEIGTPGAFLVNGRAGTISPTGMPSQSGNDWTFTFGSSASPVPTGDYLFTVGASGSSGPMTQTIAVRLSS